MPATVFAPSLVAILKIVESYGIASEPLCRELRIDPKQIGDPDARIPYVALEGLWNKAVEITADPCIGLRAARFWHPSQLGALGYAWLASESLRSGLDRLTRYLRLLTEGVIIQLKENEEELSILVVAHDMTRLPRSRIDFIMAYLTAMCRANYGESFNPASVSLTHPAPACADRFFAFFRCPVAFDAREDRLSLAPAVADQPLPSSNPRLAQLNDQIVIRYLAQLDRAEIIHRVKAAILQQLPSGAVTDSAVANRLHLHVRALQRQLQRESTTFKRLLDQVRKELGEKYIQESQLSLGEISFLLGFSDISCFSRAFKRWTGRPPSAYRVSEVHQKSAGKIGTDHVI